MSYYITYQEIPVKLLQEILFKPNDEQFHNDLLDKFYSEPNNVSKYRRLFEGNVMLNFNEVELAYYKKTNRFFNLLSRYKKESGVGEETVISTGIIKSYLSSEQLEEIWESIKNLRLHYPEYRMKIKFDNQRIFSEFPSPWEEVIKFYHSCSLNKSAAIKIEG